MKYTNLQAGRFLAAVAVLVFHAAYYAQDQLALTNSLVSPIPAYFFRTSVIFFFALSGFVLAHGLQRATLGNFLLSRLLRLYPAYWLAAATVLIVRQIAGNQLPFDNRGLIHAFTLWPAGPSRSAYSLGVEWTLVYELFLSLALIPFAALGRRWGLGIGSAIWLIAIVWKQIATSGTVFHHFPRVSELPLSAMNVAFLLGVLCYLTQSLLVKVTRQLFVFASLSLLAGAFVQQEGIAWSLLLQSFGTVCAVSYFVAVRQLSEKNWLVRAGDWSYGIYLVHVPIITAFFAIVVNSGWSPTLAIVIFGAALALIISSLFGATEWALYRRLRARTRLRANRTAAPVVEPVILRRAA